MSANEILFVLKLLEGARLVGQECLKDLRLGPQIKAKDRSCNLFARPVTRWITAKAMVKYCSAWISSSMSRLKRSATASGGRRTWMPPGPFRNARFCSGEDPVRKPASRAVIIAEATP